MGDRGNVKMVFGEGPAVFLYTHWQGTELPQTVAKALEKGVSRWDDPAYLSRVVFQEMIGNDDDVTGFGIAPYEIDPNHETIEVNCALKLVRIGVHQYSFDEFIGAFATA
jgi:hypothetical protein